MLFQSKINYPKKSSIITQITLWYSSFIFILVIGVLIGSFFISKSIAENKSKKNLEAKAVQMSQALAKGHRYERLLKMEYFIQSMTKMEKLSILVFQKDLKGI